MGCKNAKMVKVSKKPGRISEETVYWAEGEPDAATESRPAAESANAAVGAFSLLEGAQRDVSVRVATSPVDATESLKEASGNEVNNLVSAKTDTGSNLAAAATAVTETSTEASAEHQWRRQCRLTSDGDTLASTPAHVLGSATLLSTSFSGNSNSGDRGVFVHKKKQYGEKKELGFPDSILTTEDKEWKNSVASGAAASVISGDRKSLSFKFSKSPSPAVLKDSRCSSADTLDDASGSKESASVQSQHAEAEVSSLPDPPSSAENAYLKLLDEGDRLPPYEWVPRTLPVPSPLWIGAPNHMTERTWNQNEAGGFASGAGRGPSGDNMLAVPESLATASDPEVVQGSGGVLRPPVPAAFSSYPLPAQRPSTLAEKIDEVPREPLRTRNHAAYLHRRQLTFPALYEQNADAHYSPAEYDVHMTASYKREPISLVDVSVSEDRDYAQPPLLSGAHTFYPSPVPSRMYTNSPIRERHFDRPLPPSHRPPVVNTAVHHIYQYGDRSGSGQHSVPHTGVGMQRYKPVTYLFDNSMEDWWLAQHTSSQRKLYSEPTNMW